MATGSDAGREVVDAIFTHHGMPGAWTPLPVTGVANRIYATRDVVLRVATDHPEAVPDARTESVAAPVARASGLPVPALIVFDDSRRIVDRPYSIWERVHGETLGLHAPDPDAVPDTWRDVGRQLARLHTSVRECWDPNGWLDRPAHPDHVELRELAHSLTPALAAFGAEVLDWIDRSEAAAAVKTPRCFLHYDIHQMNLMCARDGSLLSIIDWGDAGWGDPALEWSEAPIRAIPYMLDGYRSIAGALLGDAPEARILADQLWCGLEDLRDRGRFSRDLVELRELVAAHQDRW
jgi:aminoglycoside phosphotransferase (APT) family kinase protein